MRRRIGLVVLVVLASVPVFASTGAAARKDPNVLQLRPVLASVPASQVSTQAADATSDAVAAVQSCDPSRVAALAKVPATPAKQVVPGACVVGTRLGGIDPEYLYLGAAKLTAADVKHAFSSFVSGTGAVVDFSLKRQGLRKLNEMARTQFDTTSPQNQVAIVVNGRVESNPSFQSPSFAGLVQVAGNFTRKQAAAIARAINRAAG